MKSRRKENGLTQIRCSKYIKPEHVHEGPIHTRIVRVFEDERYGRPMIELETGSQFPLNDGNLNTLIKAFGCDSENFIGQEVVLELGPYKDWKTEEEKETVKASRAVGSAAQRTVVQRWRASRCQRR